MLLLTGLLVLTSILSEAALAFGDGITAAHPNATGTCTWHGIRHLQDTVTYMSTAKAAPSAGHEHPWPGITWIAATVLVGRLWRFAAMWCRRRATTTTT